MIVLSITQIQNQFKMIFKIDIYQKIFKIKNTIVLIILKIIKVNKVKSNHNKEVMIALEFKVMEMIIKNQIIKFKMDL